MWLRASGRVQRMGRGAAFIRSGSAHMYMCTHARTRMYTHAHSCVRSQAVLHMSKKEAAAQLEIGERALGSRCREYGLKKWPYARHRSGKRQRASGGAPCLAGPTHGMSAPRLWSQNHARAHACVPPFPPSHTHTHAALRVLNAGAGGQAASSRKRQKVRRSLLLGPLLCSTLLCTPLQDHAFLWMDACAGTRAGQGRRQQRLVRL